MNIIDDSGGTTVYNLPTPVIVVPNNILATKISDALSSKDPTSQILAQLNSGNLNLMVKNVISLATVYNIQRSNMSSSYQNVTQIARVNNQMAELREFMMSKVNQSSLSDISSIKVISSALSAATQSPDQVASSMAVTRQKSAFCFKELKKNCLLKLKKKESSVGKAAEMVNYLNTISNQTTFVDLKQGVDGIFDTLANSLIVNCL